MNTAVEQNFRYFLGHEFEKYKEGEWVAIFGDKVISHGESLKTVISEAKKTAPMSRVLLSKIKKTASYL